MKKENNSPAFLSEIIAQCKSNPSRIAVLDKNGRETTYGELLEFIERTSGYIASKGIPEGSFILINLPNCMEYLAIEFGVWLAGCAIVPSNPAYPKSRVEYIAGHCEAALIIDEDAVVDIAKTERLEICKPTKEIAALFYTSGSTGKPKGVIHTFETLNHIDYLDEVFEPAQEDRFALGAPFAFIACLMYFPFLRKGASVNILGREEISDAHKLLGSIEKNGITCTFLSPSVLKQLSLENNRALRLIVTGSERVCNLAPQSKYRLFNWYGMTETACLALYFEVKEKFTNTPIGKATGDLEVKLMEDGEICLRGALTPGYYKDPERSSELWRGGWLHTGDLGRELPDGSIEYVNRKDWMVKINGQRVETGEIIQATKDIPGVKDAMAKGFTAPDGHQYLVDYYVADSSVNDDIIKEALKTKLPAYMIPSYFVKMAALPLNYNGKVDVKSLQSPLELQMSESREIAKPENDLQKTLCQAYEAALGISPIGIDDDFFSLGGDSIRVMQLQTICEGINLSSETVYKYRTARKISEALETEKEVWHQAGDTCPLSQTQRGIFIESMNRRGEIAYNNPILYKLTDAINADTLAAACTKAVKAHPNVFASISVDDNGIAYQTKTNGEDYEVKVENVTDNEFNSIRQSLVQPFDLLSDRLFRIRVFKAESAIWLFTDFHHIIYDGTSNSIFLEDIEQAYSGKEVKPEKFTGFDVACEEEYRRTTPFFDECKKWNADTFSEPDRTSLPDPDRFIDTVTFEKIETETGISIHSFAKAAEKLGITENVLATSIFGYMLGSCTRSLSSAFTIVYNGRKSLQTSRTMSMMVKTLPVLCKWDSKTTLGDFFNAVKEQIVGSMAHDLFSFAEICASTAYDSSVLFTYQDELLERDSLCGTKCEMISLLENATGEPLAIQLYKKNGSLTIRTEYRSNMFSELYISKFINCFTNVLSSVLLAEKDNLLASIPLVSQKEFDQLMKTGWGEKLDYDKNDTFVTMFKRQVLQHPDKTAVVDENGITTYSDLDRLSDRIAAMLIREGVQPEDFVALMMPRRVLFPASYIACYKCGACYIPLDYEYPTDRLQYMLDNSEAKILITTHDIFDNREDEKPLEAAKVVYADDLPEDIEIIPNIDRSRPDGLAYMIYTSGTTGKPKGVMIEHHALSNLIHWYGRMEDFKPGTRIAEHASFSFDASIPDLMTTPCFGAELYLIPEGLRKDLAAINRYYYENRIDGGILPTQLGMALLRMYDVKLKFLMMGGEKLSGLFKTKTRIYNGYGPTEFVVSSSYHLVDTENTPDNIPIGKAVPNTLSAVVDALGNPLPQGIAGELVLIGEQLARGYWHREDTTAERFVPCPFVPGQRMYRTGDLVKWNDEGELLFMGRIDTQVKLRGFRIELGEIESTIAKYEGIKAEVVVVKEISGNQHLCAYYCANTEIDKEKLRAFLAESLTDYMVPTAYVQLESMPMTPNGKIDMKKLPVPEVKAEEIVKPESELETKLFEIVSEYLKNDGFGVTTNLISMGLTSLGAITLSLQIERKLSISIPSPKILERPSIRQWTEFLGEEPDAETKENVKAYEKQDMYPITENQTGIYIDWEQRKDSTQYNVPLLLKFKGVPVEKITDAVRAFVEAHPYIKTCFKTVDGKVMQMRRDSEVIPVASTVLDAEPDKSFFQKRIRSFDLFDGPLCRFEMFTFGDIVWLLSDIHHIIFDGGSEAIFTKDIIDSCNGKDIIPEPFTAFDFSLYYNEWKESEEFAKAEQYFGSLLDGTVAASLPSSSNGEDKGSSTYSLSIPREGLRNSCRKSGVTENALFLTVITEVLHRFTRENNIAILTVSNGRSLSSLSRTCGMFVQTLPIVSHHASKSVAEAMKAMHGQMIDTLARDKYPYTKIVEKTGLKADILVAYQGDVLDTDISIDGKPVEMISLALDTAKFPLSINIVPGKSSTELNFEFDKNCFTEKDIKLYADAVKEFTENLVKADSDALISELSCVSPERAESLVKTGSGEKMETTDGTIISMFRKNVFEHPDDIAVVDKNGSITYAELDKASDLFADQIISSGVRKEDFVSLMLPRTKEHVIAYLGVFKSGCAYVPMDSEYPFDRLQYMIEDSMSKVLVTTRELYEKKKEEGELKADTIIFIDDVDFSKAKDAIPVDNSSPQGLAYMIYTSGTTGKPKGVMIEHHSIVNMISWNHKVEGVNRRTRVAEHASFSFDASVIDLMTTMGFGAELHILDEVCRKDPELINKYFNEHNIEVTTMSTQLGMMLLNSYKLPIKAIMMGGEKLTGKYDKSIKVINGYGPTEFTVSSSYHVVDPDKESDNIPIGKAVPNTISAVVDSCDRLLPQGVAGELVLIGPQIARGYWNKEEITSKRFVDCPFIPGQKMYHTGDLVRWNEEGELLFIGRIDTQVKLRGFRIELGEIESVMTNFDGITAAVAQVKEIGGVQHLCAYYTASCGIDEGALKTHLSSCLTSYMVPDALIQMDTFPLTPNGKVDLKKLPLPDLTVKSAEAFEAPEGDIEQAIAEAFASVLGTGAPVSRNDSFFLMGGTSLLVMKVIVILSENGYQVTYGDVFKYPTPRSLAAFLEGFAAGCKTAPAVTAEQVSEEGVAKIVKGEDGYDYSAINEVLEGNRIDNIASIAELEDRAVGDVLLLGSTGYLGIHILNELLSKTDGKVYCVIRPKKGVTCEGRLKSYLMYYFDNTYTELFGNRLFVIEGDMTDDSFMEKLLNVKVDTVINCAANVKHFAAGDEIEKINLNGTERLIEYCLKTGSVLIHTSTHSISGQMENAAAHIMSEDELYFGQKLMTKYQTSKFQAERAILEACSKGLKAKIMRLGNLMPRFSDGEFQINIENNGFMARMRAYYLIGCIPSSHLHSSLEFAPIDETASAILTLARTPDKFTVFHPFNNHTIYIDDVVAIMRKCGLNIEITDDATFSERLNECLKDDHLNPFITTLLAYGSHNNYVVNSPSLDFTVYVLNDMGWRWPITGSRYLVDTFDKMITLEYFNK